MWSEQKSGTRGGAEAVLLMFLPRFDVLLNRRTAKWNLFVLYKNRKFYLKRKAAANCSTTQRSSSFKWFFRACLAKLNASRCVRYSAACFSLKTSAKAGYFENLCRHARADFDHALESPRAVTSFVRLSSNR